MIKYCKTCLFPNTKPDLYFNEGGICDACISAKQKNIFTSNQPNKVIDWEDRRLELLKLLKEKKKFNKSPYDCVVPVSGGKDSTWQVYIAKKELKLKVLAVTFDQFDQTETGLHNLNVLRNIGVDHIHVTLNPNVLKQLVLKGLEIVGDPYWVNHVGMFTVPITIATKFSIPLVIYGENPQFEYGGPEFSRSKMIMDKRWRQEFSGMRGFREEDMIDNNINDEDLTLLKYPSDEEIKQNNISAIFLGHFFRWDPIEHTNFVMSFGWKALPKAPAGSWVDYENCDMKFIDIRERIKFLKYGYGRATDQLNIAIRLNKISRGQALEIARRLDGKISEENLDSFSKFLGITKSKLITTINSYVNYEIFTLTRKNEFKEKIERY